MSKTGKLEQWIGEIIDKDPEYRKKVILDLKSQSQQFEKAVGKAKKNVKNIGEAYNEVQNLPTDLSRDRTGRANEHLDEAIFKSSVADKERRNLPNLPKEEKRLMQVEGIANMVLRKEREKMEKEREKKRRKYTW
ncbi:MAG: hypothetical protein R6V01_04550 [Thermoplasmatota archaeon]